MDGGIYRFQIVAGHLALDFVNTVAFRADPEKKEDHLQRAEDVHRWACQAQLPDWAASKSGPRLGPAALRHIRAVREHVFAVFHAIASGEPIPADALSRVGNALQDCCAKRRLSVDAAEVRWAWRANAQWTDYLLYPVLRSATDLLTSVSRGLVRQCEAADCGWLFLDRSNARKRRWCSMADCGNRNKARNYYRREAGLI
ncbi:MAG TPA: ABATE domain-containing protein [Gemmatimonadaceae bacterium]|nr:ABATE domain-containing protein [Gemmatimonadaceae bacterium]